MEPQSVLLSSLSAAMIAGKSSIGAASDTPLGATPKKKSGGGFDHATGSFLERTPHLCGQPAGICSPELLLGLCKVSNSDSWYSPKCQLMLHSFRHNFRHYRSLTAKAFGQRSLVRHVPVEAPFVIRRSHKQGCAGHRWGVQ